MLTDVALQDMQRILDDSTAIATSLQRCYRKAVGAYAGIITRHSRVLKVGFAHNGPSGEDNECMNIQGGCGCSHAEPRVVMKTVAWKNERIYFIASTYSPCTNCANIIVDSGIFKACFYQIPTEHDARGLVILKRAMPTLSMDELRAGGQDTENLLQQLVYDSTH